MKSLFSILCFLLSIGWSLTAQTGLLAEYYNGGNFNALVGQDTITDLDIFWNEIPPIAGLDPHSCSVRYTGTITVPSSGKVTFSARVDDGIKL